PFGNAFRWDGSRATTFQLMDSLADGSSGNFFWIGHGSPTMIGPSQDGSSGKDLKAKTVAKRLDNYGLRANHPYRLVILECCDAYSPNWANAFGMVFQPNGSTYT